jgi:hypothetical protein
MSGNRMSHRSISAAVSRARAIGGQLMHDDGANGSGARSAGMRPACRPSGEVLGLQSTRSNPRRVNPPLAQR